MEEICNHFLQCTNIFLLMKKKKKTLYVHIFRYLLVSWFTTDPNYFLFYIINHLLNPSKIQVLIVSFMLICHMHFQHSMDSLLTTKQYHFVTIICTMNVSKSTRHTTFTPSLLYQTVYPGSFPHSVATASKIIVFLAPRVNIFLCNNQ